MMKNKNFTFSSTILAFLVAVIYFRCSQEVTYIPSSFMSCRLEKKLTGIEARQWVDKIHGKVVTPPESEIGFYLGENGPITVYVSGYQTEELARKELLRMTEKISSQNSIFIGGEFVELDGKNIYRCFGMGQTHFVFTHHNKLIWLSVNTIQGKEMLRAYLDLIN
ncbi:MAG: hypothetical protein A2Y94_03065 [Caldithrix sp. RBG_13_44_9]|nr:MAG: hypothetical protein A2Y94_03065 [Caldithrix sp. RBG_13_44_9]